MLGCESDDKEEHSITASFLRTKGVQLLEFLNSFRKTNEAFDVDDVRKTLTAQFVDFTEKTGEFSRPENEEIDWNVLSWSQAELSSVARLILALPPSEAPVERAFSKQKVVKTS